MYNKIHSLELDQVKNFGKVTVSSNGYTSFDTVIVLSVGDGPKLPDPAAGQFNLVWWDITLYADPSDDPNVEIVRCTIRDGDILTVSRGEENTVTSNKNTPGHVYKMILSPTRKMFIDIPIDSQSRVDAHAALIAAHGTTSSIVGISDVQVLTNKTITDEGSNVMAKSLKSATTTVDISAAAAPLTGQVLTATSSMAATWQTPATYSQYVNVIQGVSPTFSGWVMNPAGDFTGLNHTPLTQSGEIPGLASPVSCYVTFDTGSLGSYVLSAYIRAVTSGSGNVTVSIEGSLNNTDWASVSTLTPYGYHQVWNDVYLSGNMMARYFRVRVVTVPNVSVTMGTCKLFIR